MKEKPEKSILFLSDDQTLCESLALYLSGWHPASCVQTFENLELHLKEHGAALLLFDFPLSAEIVDRIKRIKATYPAVPIIFMTIYQPENRNLENELRPHVASWFYKPVDIEEIKTAVEKNLGTLKTGSLGRR